MVMSEKAMVEAMMVAANTHFSCDRVIFGTADGAAGAAVSRESSMAPEIRGRGAWMTAKLRQAALPFWNGFCRNGDGKRAGVGFWTWSLRDCRWRRFPAPRRKRHS